MADLATFDEAFLTNALMGVMPLRQLGNHVFKSRHRVDAIRAHYVAMAEAEPVLDSDFPFARLKKHWKCEEAFSFIDRMSVCD